MSRRALLAAAVLALSAALFAFKASSKMPDFEVYWRAGARALAAEPLYRSDDGHYQLKYLPAFAMLAIPAGLLPLTVAKVLWFIGSSGLIAVLLALSLRALPERRRPAWVLVAATFVAMAKFYGHELILGQVNLLFGALALAAVRLIQGRREGWGGGLIALAVIVKPYAVIFLPWLAALRARAAMAAATGAIAGALLAPAMLYGVQGSVALHRDWWRTVTESTAPNLLNPDNVSLAAMYARWLGAGPAARWFTAGTSMAVVAAAALAVARRKRVAGPRPEALEAALLLTAIPLLSPQGWDYVFLLATPAVMLFVNYDRALPSWMRALTWLAVGVAGLTLYDVMGRQAYGAFMRLSLVSGCFLVVIAALVVLRLRRAA